MWALNKKYLFACVFSQIKTSNVDLITLYLNELEKVKTYQELLEKRDEFLRGEFLTDKNHKEALFSFQLFEAFERYSSIKALFVKIWAAIDLYRLVKRFNDTQVVDEKLSEAFGKESIDALNQSTEEEKTLKNTVEKTVASLKKRFGSVTLISFVDKPERDNVCLVLRESTPSLPKKIDSSNNDCCVYDRAVFLVAVTFFVSYCIFNVVKSHKGHSPEALEDIKV